jgi:hypothetical protein
MATPKEAIRIGLAVVGEPAVVGAAHRRGERGLAHRAREEPHRRVEEGGVDAVEVHVGDPRVRVEAARAPVHELHRRLVHLALPGADGADDVQPFLAAQHLVFDEQALLAVGVDDDLGSAVAEAGVDVLVPDVHGLEDVTVGVDDVVRAGHGDPPSAVEAQTITDEGPSRSVSS